MRNMAPDEIQSFLMHGTRTGKLATVRADGRPHVVPVWFVMDGDDMIFMTWHTAVKAKNMQRDNRVTISVDDDTPPYAFIMFEGTAEILEITDEEKLAWSTQIGGRYMGEDRAEEYGKRNAVEGEFVIRVTPTKIIAKADLAG